MQTQRVKNAKNVNEVDKRQGFFNYLVDLAINLVFSPPEEEFTQDPVEITIPQDKHLRLWMKNGTATVSFKFPDGISWQHILALYKTVYVQRSDPTERELTGSAGPFTGKPNGTLSRFRDWSMNKGLATPKGKHAQAGWTFTQAGKEHLIRWLFHNDVYRALPHPRPRRPAYPVKGKKQKYTTVKEAKEAS